jgi:hypothetical protein
MTSVRVPYRLAVEIFVVRKSAIPSLSRYLDNFKLFTRGICRLQEH